MEKMEKVKAVMNKWKIKLEPKPLECSGQQINAGSITMDKSVKPFQADCDPNAFDRSI